MTVENGAAQAANDTADSAITTAADTTKDTQTDTPADEGEGEELDADGNPIATADETEELEWDGKKWVLPKDAVATLKPALLRQGDYTQKTQTLADQRKALEAEREAFGTASKEVIEARVQMHALGKTVQQYDDYFKTPEWAALQEQDPTLAQRHYLQYSQAKDQLDGAKNTVTQKEREQASETQRTRATLIAQAQETIPKIIPDWSPELDVKLANYGTEQGLSREEMTEATIRNPKFLATLNKARLFDESLKKQKTAQTFQASQQVQPVTRVGGIGGSASTRKTTDSSGDALSGDEWRRREEERMRKMATR